MIRRLAAGGMGEIFLARQAIAGTNRLVVLKRLLPEHAEDADLLAMFVDEARIAANLAHPSIVQVHEFGEDEQGHFIVMEYVAGHHLGRVLTRSLRDHKPIPIRLGAFVVHEVARALDHVHHARDSSGDPLHIVHRDISPSNVLVSFAGDVKLMDFGIARAANRTRRTNDGSIKGKFAYMAPEQVEAKDRIDARSDVFAAGILLWETTLGRRLFEGETDFETIRATLEAPIPLPSSIDPAYPADLETLVMSALERDRDRRLGSAAELAAGLKAFLRANPTDRDELAAAMAELFPDEAAESVRLVDEHTQPKARTVAPPTVLLPQSDPPTDPEVIVTPPPTRRQRWLVLGFLGVAAGAGVYVAVDHRAASVPAAKDAPVAVAIVPEMADAPERRPDATTDAGPDDASAASNAMVDARATAVPVAQDARRPPRAPDAAVADAPHVPADAATLATGEVRLGIESGESATVYFDHSAGDCHHGKALPARCTLPVGDHSFTFRVPGGVEFYATLRVGAGVAVCWVSVTRKAVRCGT